MEINMHNSESSLSIWWIGKMKGNQNLSQCTLNGTSSTGLAGLAVTAQGSNTGVMIVSAVKAQLQASWSMSQAGLASHTQDWKPSGDTDYGAGTGGTGTGVKVVGTGELF